jgi:hypothetical protein
MCLHDSPQANVVDIAVMSQLWGSKQWSTMDNAHLKYYIRDLFDAQHYRVDAEGNVKQVVHPSAHHI